MLQPNIDQNDIELAQKNLKLVSNKYNEPKSISEKIAQREMFTSEVHDALSNKLRARAIFRRMDYELLKWSRDLIDEVLEEKEEEIQEQKKKEQQRLSVLEQVKGLLSDNDFTMKDLFPNGLEEEVRKKRRPYKKRTNECEPVKEGYTGRVTTYKFQCNIFEQTYYWTGTGYLPKPFRCHLAKGHTIESCFIPKEDWIKTREKKRNTIPTAYKDSFTKLWAQAEKKKIPKSRGELTLNIDISK